MADSTDGIDATSIALGPKFRGGLLVMMNSSGRNFQFYDLGDVTNLVGESYRLRADP